MAERQTLTGVLSALPGRQYIALGFDGAGTGQDLPVGGTGHGGERCRHADQLGAGFAQRTEQLREAQVVAYRQPQAPHRSIRHHDALAMGEIIGLTITATVVGHVDIEQVQLVVTGHTLALIIDQQ